MQIATLSANTISTTFDQRLHFTRLGHVRSRCPLCQKRALNQPRPRLHYGENHTTDSTTGAITIALMAVSTMGRRRPSSRIGRPLTRTGTPHLLSVRLFFFSGPTYVLPVHTSANRHDGTPRVLSHSWCARISPQLGILP
jgi:hypothetical protein